MKIDDFFAGKKKGYVIAEISQNHDGSLGQAHAFIEAVAKTGADAIKFQTHIASEESTPTEPFRVKFSYCDNTRYDYWKRMEFTMDQWKGLFDHATELGLDFLSSPFSLKALELLESIGCPAWKFGSGEVFNDILLKNACTTGKPIILSSGLSTYADMDKQVELIREYGNKLAILECTTAYPSSPGMIPIRRIPELIARYNCPIGMSDHSATIYPSIAAVALGAQMIEVHVTMSRDMFGPDIMASVTMEELRQIVEGVKAVHTMLEVDTYKDGLSSETLKLRNMFSKSLYARTDIHEGDLLTEENVIPKKPYSPDAIEIEKYEMIIGKRAKLDILKDQIIEWKGIDI